MWGVSPLTYCGRDLDCPHVGSSHILIILSSHFFNWFPSSFFSSGPLCVGQNYQQDWHLCWKHVNSSKLIAKACWGGQDSIKLNDHRN